DTRLAPALIGEDPLFVERLWEKMFRTDMGMKKQGVVAYALSALDIGLWDVAGKVAGLPLYKLWGAVTDRIPAYGSGGWSKYSERELIAEAEKYAAQGCKYYKMKIHHADPRENAKRVGAVRRALGDGMRMMVDVNQRLDVLANIRQARSLEDFDLVWYEEPVLADDIAACAEVARAIGIPVATGENNYSRFEFRELIERRAARYLMPDVCRANGFSETLRIRRLAAAHQVAVSPPAVHAPSLQAAAAPSNGIPVEFMDSAPPALSVEPPRGVRVSPARARLDPALVGRARPPRRSAPRPRGLRGDPGHGGAVRGRVPLPREGRSVPGRAGPLPRPAGRERSPRAHPGGHHRRERPGAGGGWRGRRADPRHPRLGAGRRRHHGSPRARHRVERGGGADL